MLRKQLKIPSLRFVLLWRRAFSAKNHCCSLLFFGVASSVKTALALPALLGCRVFHDDLCSVILWCRTLVYWIMQQCIFLLWHWKSSARNHHRSCTSLVLASSATNSTKSAYSSATCWQGWEMKIWATRTAAVKWKITLLKSSYWLCSPMVVSLPQYE